MDIRNDTPFEHGIAIGMGTDRQPCLAVVLKATFQIPAALDGPVDVAEKQREILSAEEYYKGDVTGSLRLDADAVPFKLRTDIVLVGKAYAPGARPTGQVDVLLQVGHARAALRVFGDRQWLFPGKAVMIPVISEPKPFLEMPIVYERAFGGFDRRAGTWCDRNYLGTGFLGKKTKASVDGKPLPNIEDPANRITSWHDEPAPAGYGFYHPTWQPRACYSGTEKGLEQPHPLFGLASDFRHDFYNGAHPDLQVAGYLGGDEELDLINLTRDGRRRFRLPGVRPVITVRTFVEVPIAAVGAGGEEGESAEALAEAAAPEEQPTQSHALNAPLDTLVLLPDEGVFYQVWRAVWPLPDLEAGIEAIAEIHIQMAEV